jgi:hypothetical protein
MWKTCLWVGRGIDIMRQVFRLSALVPGGFVIESATFEGAMAEIVVRPTSQASICPGCATRSGRVHSRYRRRVADLPIAGRPVRLLIAARRSYCDAVLCGRRIFAERFDDGRRGATTKVTNTIFGRSIPAPYRQVPRTAVFGTLGNVRMRSAHIHRNSKAPP